MANVQAIATATAFSIPQNWKVTLDDPLVDNSKGYKWKEDTGNCQFFSKAYHVSNVVGNQFQQCAPSRSFGNFVFQVQLTILRGGCGGLLFRETSFYPDGRLYKYELCQDGLSGTTDLSRYSSDNNAQDSGYVASTLTHRSNISIKLNQLVTVTIIANGSTIRMYLNEQIDCAVSDSTSTYGKIALIADNRGSDTEVAYKNAKVWTP